MEIVGPRQFWVVMRGLNGLKLLIIGAGGHGRVVRETAEAMNKYVRIDFLDDNSDQAIGKCEDYETFRNEYSYAFVAFGSNELRSKWIDKLQHAGYEVPALIHPLTYVSPTAKVEGGTLVLPKAVINTNTVIKQGSIIGMGSLIDHDSIIEEYCHVNTGAIVSAGCSVHRMTKLDSGCVYR